MTKPRVVCLVGPTGVGKSAIALRLAGQFNGEIINADSRQVLKLFRSSRLNPLRRNSPCSRIAFTVFENGRPFFRRGLGEKALEHIEHTAFPVFVGGRGYISGPFLTALWIFRPYRMISSRDLRKRAASKARWCCIGN